MPDFMNGHIAVQIIAVFVPQANTVIPEPAFTLHSGLFIYKTCHWASVLSRAKISA